MLQQDSALKAYILFEEMRTRHPETFPATWKRTLERRVRDWKIDHRVEQEVTFDQEHLAGDVLAIDFTSKNDLKVTIAGERFDHLIFHAVLTFSNWEYAEICLSESFEAVARGIQNAFHAMGGLTERIRFDSMTAAVNNLSTERFSKTTSINACECEEISTMLVSMNSMGFRSDASRQGTIAVRHYFKKSKLCSPRCHPCRFRPTRKSIAWWAVTFIEDWGGRC